MIRMLLSASAATLAFAAVAAADAGDVRLSGGYTHFDAEGVDLGAVTLRAGYDFTNYFGIEGEGNIGVNDDTVFVGATPVNVELDYSIGGFVVGRLPVAENANLFARAGYTSASAEASAAGVTFGDDDDGWSYGVGGEWFFDGANGVRFDITRTEFDNAGESDAVGISYVRRFGTR
jgi:hypothetical protein